MRKTLLAVITAAGCLGCNTSTTGPPETLFKPVASGTGRYGMQVVARSDLGIFERTYVIHVRDARTNKTHAFFFTETGNARTMVKIDEWTESVPATAAAAR